MPERRIDGRAPSAAERAVKHRSVDVNGLRIFYREAGAAQAPAVLALHGFPSSSLQFRSLMPRLADRWRVLAPDLPGFGFSACPDREQYAYTFAHYADTIAAFMEALAVERAALYLHDYGGQVGLRLARRAPERVAALVIQNSEAYFADGRSPVWATVETYWREPTPRNREAVRQRIFTEEGIAREFLEALPPESAELIDPAVMRLAWAQIARPGTIEAMLDLHLDYRSNVDGYASLHAYFRQYRPPALILWGREDQFYSPEAALAYRRDLPEAEIHVIGGGHWALETNLDEIVPLMREFLGRVHGSR